MIDELICYYSLWSTMCLIQINRFLLQTLYGRGGDFKNAYFIARMKMLVLKKILWQSLETNADLKAYTQKSNLKENISQIIYNCFTIHYTHL